MLDENDTPTDTTPAPQTRRRSAGRPAGPPAAVSFSAPAAPAAQAAPAKPAKKAAAPETPAEPAKDAAPVASGADDAPPPAKKAARRRPAKKAAAPQPEVATDTADDVDEAASSDAAAATDKTASTDEVEPDVTPKVRRAATAAMFQAPEPGLAPARPARVEPDADDPADATDSDTDESTDSDDDDPDAPRRRRRSRGGRRRRKGDSDTDDQADSDDDEETEDDGNGGTRRRRRRARAGEGADVQPDDPENTVVRVRSGRSAEDEITGVQGSTRLEAKKQRRREGREAGRRRAPIVSEAEFLARRESVKREMVVRQRDDYTQIAVIEDNVLVEHYVARESQVSIIGNVYLGKVQNVLPSMEAAFVDIGAGRNAVLYAGEVDWTTLGNGKARKIEDALTPGQTILVQVSKDPIGQKGARLTSQVSLPGRFLVLVPGGQTSGISRKLPENERARLKTLLKEVLPENTGVIVRTAAEGATEDQLTRDVTALSARWEVIEGKVAAGKAPELLYSEPDLMIKVVRDLFNEDFHGLVVEGDDAWDMIKGYIDHVAPDLTDRVKRWDNTEVDAFTSYRLDEQIHKALDRKVFLPSGGSLVIDRTEAMTVVDVNTGKYTGSGGNLEETVTKNNLEAAEEVVRQLRLRDIGGIIVVDFIDMVLESNRDLVLRRLVECLGRDRTRHQVAEVTSLGLVQMTRKRIGTGLLESFSHECDHCHGRGVLIQDAPVEPKRDEPRRGQRGGRGNGGGGNGNGGGNSGTSNQGGRNGNGNNNAGGGNRGGAPKPAEPKPAEPRPAEPKPAQPTAAPEPAAAAPAPVVEAAASESSVPETSVTESSAPKTPAAAVPAAETPQVDAAAPPAPDVAEKPAVTRRAPRKRGSATKPAGPPAPAEPLPFGGGRDGGDDPVLTREGPAT
ncbi:Rne/Rng family ribonuclease [Aeromicrobium fastidiosum]|uniref:Ribonuclease E n=1 Tax=Aeromicrobium fastidiosum TaxID=52699 RepID=A0A641AMN2_9ACTN|nr:Rne/Rng family ribonuclease [Aeromicrobium fastidiosum]KAA1378389.1 Rne/Rng family ribonuclease [Aeromicrobium fastidiosum]MBP2392656.1 ribonuclease E [Aeromicrobium fastidiosum]